MSYDKAEPRARPPLFAARFEAFSSDKCAGGHGLSAGEGSFFMSMRHSLVGLVLAVATASPALAQDTAFFETKEDQHAAGS